MTDRTVMKAVLMLPATGVIAGVAVYAALTVAQQLESSSAEVVAIMAVAGIVGCAALLAWAWWPLASGPTVLAAVATTLGLALLTTSGTIAVAAEPYETLACADSAGEDFCGLGVLGFVPTVLAVVPWTLAGLPALFVLLSLHKRAHRTGQQASG